MKKLSYYLTVMTLAATATAFGKQPAILDNPLIKTLKTPHQTPLFSEIKLIDYEPAFEYGLEDARKDVDAIVKNTKKPTFENTIVALERSGDILNNVSMIFFNLLASTTSPEMDAIAERVQPKLVEYSNDISLNPELFKKVKAVYDKRSKLSLDKEDARLLEKTYKNFVRGGAGLSDAEKESYRKISTELSLLSLQFEQNVLAATNAFTLNIPAADSAKVKGLPEFVLESMTEEAKTRGQEGWTITLQAASYVPFMTYSSNRELKEQLWKASSSRCLTDTTNKNTDKLKRIAELRLESAKLLGYPTYAAYVLEEKMAGNVETVNSFLEELRTSTMGQALKDVETIQAYGETIYGKEFKIMPWDFSYVSEKYKAEKYAVSDEEIKPYLELNNVKKGIIDLAGRLYGIKFVENPSIQVYDPEVTAYEVFEEDGKTFLGVIYMDFFPRESKRGGAWMTSFRDASVMANGTEIRPLISLTGNFTKPTASTPSLLTFDEFETFLHEFGHCMHGLFGKGKYASINGTSVYHDFVELPSQIMENWATEKEFLDMFAIHYKTGEKMPQELIEKIVNSKNYLAAYTNVRQLNFGICDMAWHTITEPVTVSVEEFETKATAKAQLLPVIEGIAFSPSFSHVFGGGYAAGYYGYKWAEVLEADAYSLFEEQGILNRETGNSFRENILSKGDTEHPMTLYVRFRGHEPETKALVDKILK